MKCKILFPAVLVLLGASVLLGCQQQEDIKQVSLTPAGTELEHDGKIPEKSETGLEAPVYAIGEKLCLP